MNDEQVDAPSVLQRRVGPVAFRGSSHGATLALLGASLAIGALERNYVTAPRRARRFDGGIPEPVRAAKAAKVARRKASKLARRANR